MPRRRTRPAEDLEPPVEIRVRPLRTAEGAFVLAPAATPSDQGAADWQQALQEQLEFERFVAELSGQFINVPVEQFADATREGLRRVCEHVNLDRSVCYTIDAERRAGGVRDLGGPRRACRRHRRRPASPGRSSASGPA